MTHTSDLPGAPGSGGGSRGPQLAEGDDRPLDGAPQSSNGPTQGPDPASTGQLVPLPVTAEAEPDPADDEHGLMASPRQLHPLPRGLVELYGLLAVLFVLVPEWMAGSALFGFRDGREGSELPAPSAAWKRLPELRLASLNLAELRQLAQSRRLRGYARQSRSQLTARLLTSLKRHP